MRDEQQRAREGLQRRFECLAALQVEVVRRLVQQQEVRPGGDDDRQCETPPLAAGEDGDWLLVRLPAGEEKAPEQRLRPRPVELRRGLHALERGLGRVELDLLLREVPGHHPVPERTSEERLEQRRLAGAVRADQRHVLAAVDRERGVSHQDAAARTHFEILGLHHRAAGTRRVEELEAERPAPARDVREPAGGRGALLLEPSDLG